METGFLNPIHDEEHFQSTFYNQESDLNASDAMLFGELIVPEVIDFDNLWPSVDNTSSTYQSGEQATRKEDFQRMYFECQQQLNYMQEPEAIKQIVLVAEKTTQEVSEMFADHSETASTPSAPSIDELFPLECNKDSLEESEERSEDIKEEPPLNIQEKKDESLDIHKSCNEEPPNLKEDDREEFNVDVETIEPETPLLLAGDLTSLLEQFEATEKVNLSQEILQSSPPRPSSQTIRDALPAEVIDRIKASRENHKKMISVIPAMPSKRPGKTPTNRMQDAGVTLSRNKLLKLVSGGSNGESVQLDHDYCTNGDTASVSSRSFYVSDSSEYPSQSSTPDTTYSRLPEFFVSMASQVPNKRSRAEPSSRKDSGLESGDNSDEEVQPVKESKNKVVLKSVSGLKTVNVVTENGVVIGSAPVMQTNIPMMSVLKKNIKIENNEIAEHSNVIAESTYIATSTQDDSIVTKETGKKKKKLNLEEYRVRRERERFRSQESSRANSPCCTPPAQPDSTTVPQEGAPKEKPVMLSVEVQTQTCDFIDLTSSKSSKEKSWIDRKDKRNNLKRRSYRSRHTSSSCSSVESGHHHSHRRRRRSRSNRRKRNSASRMWSRSPSRSPSRSNSASSRSRSRSHGRRQKWRSRSPHNNHRYSNYGFHRRDKPWHGSRVRSPVRSSRTQDFGTQEKVRQVEERRVIYVGRINEGTSKTDLRRRFQNFGPIVDISVHFREVGDNYGFVTFAYKADAYKAVEHGNDDPNQPRYDLCFGGRRAFCKQRYADLDGAATTTHCQYGSPVPPQRPNESFDLLLHEVKAQLRKRSSD